MAYKVLLTGPPCSGKTTLLEIISKNLGIYLIPEVARRILDQSPELKAEPHFQTILLQEQLRLETEAEKSNSEIIICDRGYLDVIAYSRFFNHPVDQDLVAQFKPYDLVFYLSAEGITSTGEYATEKGLVERSKLDEILKDLLTELQIPYQVLTSSPENRLSQFIEAIKTDTGIEFSSVNYSESHGQKSPENK